ncbi:MAG: chorismate synthase, partial [Campylobacter sp.]|nr:chorismate synthase [Campylobacter sp.]
GASVLTIANGVPKGLGEPLYAKADALIGGAFMGLNGVKAVEIGDGEETARKFGSQNNDFMDKNGFKSNHAGGILGGITTGEQIIIKTHFKPTPSIFADQPTIDKNGDETICSLRGRHDPCIGVRGSIVCTALLRLILADLLLLNASANLENLKKIYG